jgi:hypothetical protein
VEEDPQESQLSFDEKNTEALKQLKKDYLAVFSSEAGKRVLSNLEKICYIYRTTFSSQEGRTLLNEGMRFVVVHIKNMMTLDLEQLKKLSLKGE